MKDQIILDWTEPFSFEELLTDENLKSKLDRSGVYIWMEPDPKAVRVFYIGKAEGKPSLWARQVQHYMYYVGGIYHLPAKYRDVDEDWVPGVFPENAECVLDEEKMISLVKEGMRFAKQLKIYFAPVDGDHKKSIKSIERELLYTLKPSGTNWGTNTPPSTRIDILHENAKWYRPDLVPDGHEIKIFGS